MLRYLPVRRIHARQVLDSRGNPTVEVEVTAGEGIVGIHGYTARAIVPSGASTGRFEAVELRDGEKGKYLGLSVEKAVNNVNTKLAEAIVGENALDQMNIDRLLAEVDGTDNKSSIGANAVLGVSLAVARAAAEALRIPLYQYLGGCHTRKLPVPMMNILNGGRHADNTVDLQEFMIMPVGAEDFSEGIRMCVEIYQFLKIILKEKNLSTAVGDEGGFAPDLEDSRDALALIIQAVERAGYEPGKQIAIAIDAAASELYEEEKGVYYFPGESKMKGKDVFRDSSEMIEYYEGLLEEFPVVSLEDGLEEDDWEGWKKLTERLGDKIQLVGDDLFVTNKKRLTCGIRLQAANAVLVKVNQIGTLTEAMDTVRLAQENGYRAVISHRSGETEDSFIADLAVATGAGQIKTGAPCRSDRNAKYNQLLRIAEQLGENGEYQNPFRGFSEENV
ncbi:phosphopyruvate hydratase [Blautia sp. CAG:257]|uniref:phosphopyruvate hydratase n=1 Tax=Blautia sp. CAG:257 TaxID=1262756 RepID=UPI000337049F|nr:phosphopyruvate hydratase [Blautia sp. CAG:257]CDA05883.1 enolase 2 [Blautia sp. CAG:257]